MTTFANISEMRLHINPFIKKVQNGEQIIVLKYGKPTAVLVDYQKMEEFKKLEIAFQENQKIIKSLNLQNKTNSLKPVFYTQEEIDMISQNLPVTDFLTQEDSHIDHISDELNKSKILSRDELWKQVS